MFAWFAQHYASLIINFRILLDNPSGCYAVDYLQLYTTTLLVLLVVKILLHLIIYHLLKRSHRLYSDGRDARLLDLFRQAARAAGVKKVPPLYRFGDERPLSFAIGVWRPAVFLAPRLAGTLPDAELEATLVHELSHLRRWDNLRIWLLELLFALIPALVIQLFAIQLVTSGTNSDRAIWGAAGGLLVFKLLLWKPLRSLRERNCDDLTVAIIKDPLTLASSLIRAWRLSRSLPQHNWCSGWVMAQPFLFHRSGLEARVRRLLDYRPPRVRPILWRVSAMAGVLMLGIVLAFLIRFHTTDQSLLIEQTSNLHCRFQALTGSTAPE